MPQESEEARSGGALLGSAKSRKEAGEFRCLSGSMDSMRVPLLGSLFFLEGFEPQLPYPLFFFRFQIVDLATGNWQLNIRCIDPFKTCAQFGKLRPPEASAYEPVIGTDSFKAACSAKNISAESTGN